MEARKSGQRAGAKAGLYPVPVSTDLELTQGAVSPLVSLSDGGVVFEGGGGLSWQAIEKIDKDRNGCYWVEDGEATKIKAFSEQFNRAYSLMPTARAPTLLVAGFSMHRIKGIDPHEDTLRKSGELRPKGAVVLDTCTGLGYTAIEAARTAAKVTTIELDPVVLEIAKMNPWSAELFEAENIEQIVGDACEAIANFEDGAFTRIMHDPPTVSLGGGLYSGAFYAELHRVLRPRGRIFHYVGNLESASGRRTVKGVIDRLRRAGFKNVSPRPEAFGVVGSK